MLQIGASRGVGRTAGAGETGAQRARERRLLALGAMLLAGLLIRVALIQAAGYRDDMLLFYDWFKNIASLPPAQIYAHTPGLNYPPGYVVLSEISAALLRMWAHGAPTESQLNVALKLPPILFDIGGAALAYVIVSRRAGFGFGLAAAAFIALNPAIIYDSAYWGQDDSIPTVGALVALWACARGNVVVAWPVLVFAALVKPPVLVLVPLLLLAPFAVEPGRRARAWRQTALGIIAALALADVLAVTFFAHPTPIAAFRHLCSQLVTGSSYFRYNSLNAFNLWAIVQPFFTPDSARLVVTQHVWGDLLFVTAAAPIYWRFATRRDSEGIFEAAALVLLAFFSLLTEMHERYLYYGLMFLGISIFKPPYRAAALLLSLTLLLNLEYGLTFMYLDDARATVVNRYEFAPWLVHLCALTNVGVFLFLLAEYLGWRPALHAGLRRLRPLLAFADAAPGKPG